MAANDELSAIQWHPLASELALPLLVKLADQEVTVDALMLCVLPRLVHASGSEAGGIVLQQGQRWTSRNWIGPPQPVPETLVADVLDAGVGKSQGGWAAAPLDLGDGIPRAVALWGGDAAIGRPAETAEMAGRLLGTAAAVLRQISDAAGRCRRLQTMLDIAGRWQLEEDPEALLRAVASASTELLGAERASIFLWDRRRKKLVGRPALGVGDAPLEVDDSAGIVGAVLHTGQPRRWAADDGEAEVNRSVDQALNFRTRSLVAVPLEDRFGKRAGVFEVINKIDGCFTSEDVQSLQQLAVHASAAIHNTQDRQALTASRDRLVSDAAGGVQIVGQSPAIEGLRETISRVGATDLAVLVLGENGTGKEVLARSIHFQSSRRHEPFVAVNCAALVETLLESELFGHEKGAFTDAHQARPGKFELAHHGTLFLDEVGDMSLGGQAKLLRVLEEKVVVRVGGSTPIPVDVRVIAATNQPLAELVRSRRFREDLYFRLNVVTLQLPPLRARGDDVLVLAEHFLHQFAHQIGRRPPRLAESARRAMLQHGWAGNIRELRNLMERVSYLCPSDVLEAGDLSFSADPRAMPTDGDAPSGQESGFAVTLAEATRRFQVARIRSAIEACRGNMTDAAARLGLHRSNLYRKMRQLGMETGEAD